jgi:hypothetical protein
MDKWFKYILPYKDTYHNILLQWQPEPLNRNESGRFGALKSDSTHHFFRNACTHRHSNSGPPFFLICSLPLLWYGSLYGSIYLNHLSIFYNISCYNSLVLLTFVSTDGFYGLAVAVGRQRALHTQNSGFSLQLWVSTFPRFVAIWFYFLSETLI